ASDAPSPERRNTALPPRPSSTRFGFTRARWGTRKSKSSTAPVSRRSDSPPGCRDRPSPGSNSYRKFLEGGRIRSDHQLLGGTGKLQLGRDQVQLVPERPGELPDLPERLLIEGPL